MKTHFDPYADDDTEQAPCGTLLGERSGLTGDWESVDCRRCLDQKAALIADFKANEAAIVAQMGDMVAFFKQQETAGQQKMREKVG